MTKLKIQQLNSTSQLTATEQQKVSGGSGVTPEQERYLLTLYAAGAATIETGNDPRDVRFRDPRGDTIAEGVELYS